MRIDDLRVEERRGWRRIAARVVPERSPRPPVDLWFEVPVCFAEELSEAPDPFLVASLPLAVALGESRLRVEGALCSRLGEGAAAAAEALSSLLPEGDPPAIEAERLRPTSPRAPGRAASFLTGGVDSLALLRANRMEYPRHHPDSIRSCYVLFGLLLYELENGRPRPDRLAAYRAQLARLRRVADDAGVELVPVRTNARSLYEDYAIWAELAFGAGVVAAALALPGRADRAWIASDALGLAGWPNSLHPLLLPLYSTAAVTVRVGQPSVGRLEKTRLVVDWKPAREVLEVCTKWSPLPPDVLNCGRCEKCLRTAVALLALGRLEEVETLPLDDLRPDDLAPIGMDAWYEPIFYRECLEPLERRGRADIAKALRRKIQRHERKARFRRRWRWLRGEAPGP